jgi:hypothetical protein
MDNKKDEIPKKEWLTKEGHKLHRAEGKAGGYAKRRKLLWLAIGLTVLGAVILGIAFNQ